MARREGQAQVSANEAISGSGDWICFLRMSEVCGYLSIKRCSNAVILSMNSVAVLS